MNNTAIETAASIANNISLGTSIPMVGAAAEAAAAIAGYDNIIDVTYANPLNDFIQKMEVYPPRRMVTYG